MQTEHSDTAGDWVEQTLRADGADYRSTYVGDDGFAARILARLPEPATLPVWRRPVVALLWLCAAAATLIGIPGLFDDAFRGAVALFVGHRIGVADVVALLAVLGAAAWGMLFYAVRVD